MVVRRSKLSSRVTRGYWMAVRELLQKDHHLSLAAARRAVLHYQAVLAKLPVGDEVYHAPIAETAEGIVVGGYVESSKPTSVRQRVKRPTTVRRLSTKVDPAD